jgi:hypothetical protein
VLALRPDERLDGSVLVLRCGFSFKTTFTGGDGPAGDHEAFSGRSPAIHSALALQPRRRIEAPDGEVERGSKRDPREVG